MSILRRDPHDSRFLNDEHLPIFKYCEPTEVIALFGRQRRQNWSPAFAEALGTAAANKFAGDTGKTVHYFLKRAHFDWLSTGHALSKVINTARIDINKLDKESMSALLPLLCRASFCSLFARNQGCVPVNFVDNFVLRAAIETRDSALKAVILNALKSYAAGGLPRAVDERTALVMMALRPPSSIVFSDDIRFHAQNASLDIHRLLNESPDMEVDDEPDDWKVSSKLWRYHEAKDSGSISVLPSIIASPPRQSPQDGQFRQSPQDGQSRQSPLSCQDTIGSMLLSRERCESDQFSQFLQFSPARGPSANQDGSSLTDDPRFQAALDGALAMSLGEVDPPFPAFPAISESSNKKEVDRLRQECAMLRTDLQMLKERFNTHATYAWSAAEEGMNKLSEQDTICGQLTDGSKLLAERMSKCEAELARRTCDMQDMKNRVTAGDERMSSLESRAERSVSQIHEQLAGLATADSMKIVRDQMSHMLSRIDALDANKMLDKETIDRIRAQMATHARHIDDLDAKQKLDEHAKVGIKAQLSSHAERISTLVTRSKITADEGHKTRKRLHEHTGILAGYGDALTKISKNVCEDHERRLDEMETAFENNQASFDGSAFDLLDESVIVRKLRACHPTLDNYEIDTTSLRRIKYTVQKQLCQTYPEIVKKEDASRRNSKWQIRRASWDAYLRCIVPLFPTSRGDDGTVKFKAAAHAFQGE